VGYQSVVSAIYGTASLIQNTGDAILVQCQKAAELIQTTARAILRERK